METRGFIGNQEGLRKPGVYRKPGGLWETKGFIGNQGVTRKPGSL